MQPAPFKPVKLNPVDQRKWEDTLAAMSWIAPGFVHIIYTLLSNTSNKNVALFTEDMKYAAATDGYQIIIKPSKFFKYDLLERVFACLHEVMHEIGDHCRVSFAFRQAGKITVAGKTLPFSMELANYMQDFVINDTLIEAKWGKFNENWLHDTGIATKDDEWVEAYFRNWKNPPPQMGGKGGKPDDDKGKDGNEPQDGSDEPGEGRFDAHLDPHRSEGKNPVEAPKRLEAQWELGVKAAMEIQRAQGKLPASMEQFFERILKPKVEWSEHIKTSILRIAGSGAYDWRKLDRRLITRGIGAPGLTGRTIDVLAMGADSSGSIFADKTLIQRWFGEIGGIVEECNPRKIWLIWCDAEIQRVDEIEDVSDLKKVFYAGAKGGGGTSFVPVFEHIEKEGLNPDMLIYLTDGDGEFPKHEPDYPVIWGDISKSPKKYPFGAVVQVPVVTQDE